MIYITKIGIFYSYAILLTFILIQIKEKSFKLKQDLVLYLSDDCYLVYSLITVYPIVYFFNIRYIFINFLMKAQEVLFPISKSLFVTIKKENINTYYEVVAKVSPFAYRNSEKERSEPSTKEESKVLKVPGVQLRKFPKRPSRIHQPF